MSRPIAVYSYNRPNYLHQTLQALQPQTNGAEVFLFQDGPINHPQDVTAVTNSINVFKKFFPNSKTFESPINLGVAFNQKRGREFIFDNFDSAIFVEDDIVLNPYYIEQLNLLMDKFQDDQDIGMISCFGESHRHTDVFDKCKHLIKHSDWKVCQEKNKHKFMQMEHLWAYGYYKTAYEKVKDFMDQYYALIPTNYAMRPHQEIYNFVSRHGIDPSKIVSSQDSVLSASLIKHGIIKLSTFTLNAKYVGEWGVHSRPDNYAQHWKYVIPYNQKVTDFEWDEDIKKSILEVCKSKSLA